MPPKRDQKGIVTYIILLAVLLFVAAFFYQSKPVTSAYKYNEIVEFFEKGEVTEFTLNLGTGELSMVHTRKGVKSPLEYNVPYLTWFREDVSEYIEAYDLAHPGAKMKVDYLRAKEQPWLLQVFPSIVLIVGCGVLWYMMLRQSRGSGGGNVMGFGKAKPKQNENGRRVYFKDVAGAAEEKEELVEIVDFLKNPAKFNSLGARIPKGVLLVGPPGTGKTLLARAVSGEANVPFFSISGSDFVEMFVGVGASRVRDLFEQAKKSAPSIIFIDEIDAVGRRRGAGLGGGHDEREQTLNQLLVEMDGFAANSGVIIIAATNRKDILDPAILRPGRFDRQIFVGYPDVKGREEILEVHTRSKPLGPDVNLETIAKSTYGFTGADLENVINEAALAAAKKNKKAITMSEIEEATIKVVMGPEKKSRVKTEKDKELTAYHEAGHAICHYILPTQDPVHEISIISRGGAGGYTMSLPEEEKTYNTKLEMSESLVSFLGGRVAEKLVLTDISTGASSDLQRATKIARAMVTTYGFSEKLGPVVYGGNDQGEVFLGRDFSQNPSYSQEIAAVIDEEVKSLMETAFKRAEDILNENMDKLHEVSKRLLVTEKMDAEEFTAIMEGREYDPSKARTLFGLKKEITKPEESAEDSAAENKEKNDPPKSDKPSGQEQEVGPAVPPQERPHTSPDQVGTESSDIEQ